MLFFGFIRKLHFEGEFVKIYTHNSSHKNQLIALDFQ